MSDSLRDALREAWDDGNATGLDGYVGPGRGAGQVDPEAELARDRVVGKLLAAHPVEPDVDDLAARLRVSVDAAKARRLGHPAEPAPVATGESRAVFPDPSEVAPLVPRYGVVRCGVCGEPLQKMDRDRFGCPTCAPLLSPRPLLDREAAREAISKKAQAVELDGGYIAVLIAPEDAADAVMELARPMPTREQIDELLQLHRVGPMFQPPDPDRPGAIQNYRRKLRNAVLALLNGAES